MTLRLSRQKAPLRHTLFLGHNGVRVLYRTISVYVVFFFFVLIIDKVTFEHHVNILYRY